MLVQEDQYDDDKCEADTEGIVDNVFSVIDAVIKKKINYIVIAEEIISLFQEGKNALKVCRSYESVYEGIADEYVKRFNVPNPAGCKTELGTAYGIVSQVVTDVKAKSWISLVADGLAIVNESTKLMTMCKPE